MPTNKGGGFHGNKRIGMIEIIWDIMLKQKILLSASLVLLSFSVSMSQNLSYQALLNDVEWGEGSVINSNGTEFKGLISYNDKKGTVSFENGSESKTFIARQILGFEYFDRRVDRQRIFYSLEYEDDQLQNSDPLIFEVLKEFKTFAVLYKTDPVEFKQKESWANYHTPGAVPGTTNQTSTLRNYSQITQRETIYLFPSDGKITPLLEMSLRQSEGRVIDLQRNKSKLVNRDILVSCTGSIYPELEVYVKSNGLDLNEREDLMIFFEYYEKLISGN